MIETRITPSKNQVLVAITARIHQREGIHVRSLDMFPADSGTSATFSAGYLRSIYADS